MIISLFSFILATQIQSSYCPSVTISAADSAPQSTKTTTHSETSITQSEVSKPSSVASVSCNILISPVTVFATSYLTSSCAQSNMRQETSSTASNNCQIELISAIVLPLLLIIVFLFIVIILFNCRGKSARFG